MVTLSDNLHQQLEDYCGKDLNKSVAITLALREFLDKENKKESEGKS
jgi:metal-responsive CopG/Arc/MetJ family transcriptional regulator